MADPIELFECLTACARARNALRFVSEKTNEWAGIPLPLEGHELVVEPSYPWADLVGRAARSDEKVEEGVRIRNCFWSWRLRCDVLVWEEGGKIHWGPASRPHHIDQEISTLAAADAWGVEQEGNAVDTLGGMLSHVQFRRYLFTGMFLETSRRSGVKYLFRRLKPTIALRQEGERVRILCALCLHPIAYYADSWAGAMCPTDDVIAHLTLMRGDEEMFWGRANQHAPHRPEAGI